MIDVMLPVTDAQGGALLDVAGDVMEVALWGTPRPADYTAVARAAALEPRPLRVTLDLTGLTTQPTGAVLLAEGLRASEADVRLLVAPHGRVAESLRALDVAFDVDDL
jgi:hypothetical protein